MDKTQQTKMQKKKINLASIILAAVIIIAALYLFLDMDRTPANVITVGGFDIKINSTKVSELREAGFSVTGGPVMLGGREFTVFSYDVEKDGVKYGSVGLANYSRSSKMAEECTVISYYSNMLDKSQPLLNGKNYNDYTLDQIKQEFGEPESDYEYSSEIKYSYGKKKKNIEMTFDKDNGNNLEKLYVEYNVQ